jgi:hypothetical protein
VICLVAFALFVASVVHWGRSSTGTSPFKDEDYDVLADGKVVGRIYKDGSASTLPVITACSCCAGNSCRSTSTRTGRLPLRGA